MTREFQEIRGRVTLVLVNREAETLLRMRANNTIVDTGRERVAQLFGGIAGESTLKVKVGTNGEGVLPQHNTGDRGFIAEADIQSPEVSLDPETGRARLRFSATFEASAANEKLREAGIVCSGGEAPVLYNAVTFSTIDKKSGDVLTLNWEIFF